MEERRQGRLHGCTILGGESGSLRGSSPPGGGWCQEASSGGLAGDAGRVAGEMERGKPHEAFGGRSLPSRLSQDLKGWGGPREQASVVVGPRREGLDEEFRRNARSRRRAGCLESERRRSRQEGRRRSKGQREESELKLRVIQEEKEEEEKSKKKKKDGEDDPEEGKKVQGTKDLKVVFGKTGLDPNALVRKRMMRRAKKVAKKKSRKDSSSTSGSTGSEGSDTQEDEGSSIFGEEARIKTVWSRIPGALTMQTLNQMQLSLVRQSGQPWELSQSQVPPIFSQYWRMFLYGKVTGPMNREIQSICYAQDLLLQGRIAQACDVLTQRVKSLEQTSAGGDWRISQRQELTPLDVASLSTNVETLDASKLHREEMKAKAAARPWERRGKGDYDSWDAKGKGKGKDKGKKGNKGPWGKNRDGEEKDGKEKGKS